MKVTGSSLTRRVSELQLNATDHFLSPQTGVVGQLTVLSGFLRDNDFVTDNLETNVPLTSLP